MKRKDFLRLALAGTGASLLTSCGGSSTPIVNANTGAGGGGAPTGGGSGATTGTPAVTPSAPAAAETPDQRRDKFVGRMLDMTRAFFELTGVYLGDRLGLYAALAKSPNQTSTQLAAATKTNERYIREWLEHQTVAGILEVADEKADAKSRQYSLPRPYVEVLTDTESLNYVAPIARLALSTTAPLPKILDAYRTGKGVPWSAYGADAREGQGAINRATFLQQLGKEWLPAIKDVDARLKAQPNARVADIGCGAGWSSIAIAQAYPNVLVDGYDVDAPAIALANANAKAAGVSDRVKFHAKSAYDPKLNGTYDLVAAFEMLHDLSRPVDALKTMKRLAGAKGAVLIVDERVGERFSTQADEVERLMYGWSVLMCLPTGKDDKVSAETGTVMRADTVRAYAKEAGFTTVDVLPIENYFFRLYLLRA